VTTEQLNYSQLHKYKETKTKSRRAQRQDIIIIIIHYYNCAGTTTVRPITETAQEHKKSTQITKDQTETNRKEVRSNASKE
jgi:hypothetical protein